MKIIILAILGYWILSILVYMLLVKLEKAKIITMFGIKDEENANAILCTFFWPVFLLAIILVFPGSWAKRYLRDH